jgi:hypothetical protein
VILTIGDAIREISPGANKPDNLGVNCWPNRSFGNNRAADSGAIVSINPLALMLCADYCYSDTATDLSANRLSLAVMGEMNCAR